MAGERTEQATTLRRQKAEQAGQVLRSRELASAITLFFVIQSIAWMAAGWVRPWRAFFERALEAGNPGSLISSSILVKTGLIVGLAAGPVIWIAFGLVTGMNFLQGGFVFSTQALGFNFSRIN